MPTPRRPSLSIDPAAVPFSRRGAWMAVSLRSEAGETPALWVRDLLAAPMWGDDRRFRISLIRDGAELPTTCRCDGVELVLTARGAEARLAFAGPDALRIAVRGAALRLAGGGMAQALAADWVRVLHGSVWGVEALRGRLELDAPWTVDSHHRHACSRVVLTLHADGGEAALALSQGETDPRRRSHPTWAEVVAECAADLAAWPLPALPPRQAVTGELAAYVNWSCEVAPAGFVRRPVLLMSKNWMRGVWSWDHCFNALALAAAGDHRRAWDNFMVFAEVQLPDGAYPDLIAPHAMITGFVKPPVHGWALGHLRRLGVPGRAELLAAYRSLGRATRFWLTARDPDGTGLPLYFHGNDSGWDNASIFDMGFPAAGPDLAALLADQAAELAEVADVLGRAREARTWRATSERLVGLLLTRLWTGERFVARRPDGACADDGQECLLAYLPLILGRRLPIAIRRILLTRLARSGILTRHGPATEAPSSRHHLADGYWRGPVWAPSTVLLVEGLRRCGATALARRAAEGFLAVCARSGFAENFAAGDGRALRDPAYTWTSSAWLWLAGRHR